MNKRVISFLLSLLMLAGTCATVVVPAAAADDAAAIKKGEFNFAPHTYTEGDLTDI